MDKETMFEYIQRLKLAVITLFKWLFCSVVCGCFIGSVGAVFHLMLGYVGSLRVEYPFLLFGLPVAGIIIVFMYNIVHEAGNRGTNLVITAIQSNDEVPGRVAPLIIVSTLLTHLCGGSAGREGAALQVGGALGNTFAKLFKFDEKDTRIMIMCGMSAAFSALFGTPMAAAIFPLEVVSVGIMHYSALVPCVISALVAHGLALHFQIAPPSFAILDIPEFGISSAVTVTVLAVLCALVSILFCISLHYSEAIYRKFIKNPYLRAAAGGCIIILLTLLVGNQDYNGTGVNIISKCFDGTVAPEAFLLKIIFTALTLGAGFKGGEIVPTFFIGASFGCLFGTLTGFSPTLSAAIGMAAIFCGVTNSPITSLLISFEMFGFAAMPFLLLAIAFSYMLSGYYGLYRSQKIMYSKFKTSYINKQTH